MRQSMTVYYYQPSKGYDYGYRWHLLSSARAGRMVGREKADGRVGEWRGTISLTKQRVESRSMVNACRKDKRKESKERTRNQDCNL